jgi:hypothetical protein
MGTKCFMIEPIGKRYQWLRRLKFVASNDAAFLKCPGSSSGHDALVRIEDLVTPVPQIGQYETNRSAAEFLGDSRWPVKCDFCEYRFVDADGRDVFDLRVYADADGHEFILPMYAVRGVAKAPAGAMYWSPWTHHPDTDWVCSYWDGCRDPRGHLHVICPGGSEWDIDSRASNCTMPNDRGHRCWVRHGQAPMITIDKSGKTCAAGAGSIVAGTYHGCLRNGELT